MELKFNDLYWHDSVIENIFIDRSNPGNRDEVRIEVDWYDQPKSYLIFEDVYFANLNLNFGVVAPESIRKAFIITDDNIITSLYEKMKGFWPHGLITYIIETNSTASEIKIVAKGFRISPI